MNKKNAIFAVVQLPENMVSEITNSGTNVLLANGFSQEVIN